MTGPIIWSSGTLTITGTGTGNNGHMDINGGSLTINGGTVQIGDADNGDLDVISGSITIAAGALLTSNESIEVYSGASVAVSGTMQSKDSFIDINSGGTITVGSTGTIQSSSNGGNQDILVQGTLINSGTVDSDDDIVVSAGATVTNNATGSLLADDNIDLDGTTTNSGTITANNNIDIIGTVTNTGSITGDVFTVTGTVTSSGTITTTGTSDFIVDGGTVTIQSPGQLSVTDDLKVYGGGTVTIDAGATVNVSDNVVNNTNGDNSPLTGASQGVITVNGTLNVDGNLTINDTGLNSGLLGTGTVVVQGTFADNEVPPGPFSSCAGGGATCNSVLPIELSAFTAEQVGGRIELKWTTESEIDNDYFTIEKLTGHDLFVPIHQQRGSGTTKAINHYLAYDEQPAAGKNYYRLKQTDLDGKFTYSNLVHTEFIGEDSKLSVYPNPSVDGQVTVGLSGLYPGEPVSITFFTTLGEKMKDQNAVADSTGKLALTISPDMGSGIFLLRVKTLNREFSQKLIFQK